MQELGCLDLAADTAAVFSGLRSPLIAVCSPLTGSILGLQFARNLLGFLLTAGRFIQPFESLWSRCRV
jgi:hypothetical protein